MTNPIWTPTTDLMEGSNLQKFIKINEDQLTSIDYQGLYEWSITRPEAFWEACWHFSGIRATTDYKQVLSDIENSLKVLNDNDITASYENICAAMWRRFPKVEKFHLYGFDDIPNIVNCMETDLYGRTGSDPSTFNKD